MNTMVASSFQLFVIAVLASTFIGQFDLSRFEVGLIGSLNTGVGALTAPLAGRLTDAIGPRNSVIGCQAMAGLGLLMMAAATNIYVLIGATAILGWPQGWGNSATNALISERELPGRQGITTGIKQSGVQLGIFLAGATLPGLENRFGWRPAVAAYGLAFIFGSALSLLMAPKPLERSNLMSQARSRTAMTLGAREQHHYINMLAIYAFLMGSAGGAVGRFLALFAEEEVGVSNLTAGRVIAVSGLCGIVARVIVGRQAEHSGEPVLVLRWLALIAVSVPCLLLAITASRAWVLWPTAVLVAIGYAAWNAAAMLAVIMGVPARTSGKASGTVMLGFLGGLAVGAPIAGLTVDTTGGYTLVWIAAAAVTAASIYPVNRALRLRVPRSAT